MSFETTGHGLVHPKAVWGGAIRAAMAVAIVAACSGCGDLVRQGTGSSYLIVSAFEAASGATPQAFGGTLQSDVVTVVDGSGTIFNDVGRVRLTLAMKDAGGAGTPTSPTINNSITLTRYRVEYIRADGRNTEGVDVPFGFDGAITATISGAAEVAFTLVRHQAKLEAPLASLARNSVIISTIARVTFYGRDQTGRDASVQAQISVDFANFGDPG
jgi:hypothetical protein